MIYEFGIMSNKWSVECDNEIVAKIAISLYVQKNIPIAMYKPESGAFKPIDVLRDNEEFANKNADNIQEAYKTIKVINNG